jgi:hypothetical protein
MPIYAELSAKPLQAVNGHVLKQTLRWLDAGTQPPANRVLELLQRNAA